MAVAWMGKKPFKALSSEMIEAFIDDWHRSKILSALEDNDTQSKVLRWLQENEVAIYRQPMHPGSTSLQSAVFPPTLDFLDKGTSHERAT
jgi:hypothetical protein